MGIACGFCGALTIDATTLEYLRRLLRRLTGLQEIVLCTISLSAGVAVLSNDAARLSLPFCDFSGLCGPV